jgi:hypothetical protein
MMLRSKLVAAVLAGVLLALPTSAPVSCRLHTSSIGNHATECQMMSKRSTSARIQEAIPGARQCCEPSSGKPMPASVAQVPSAVADGVTLTSTVSGIDLQSFNPEREPTDPVSGPTAQAILCVFLI